MSQDKGAIRRIRRVLGRVRRGLRSRTSKPQDRRADLLRIVAQYTAADPVPALPELRLAVAAGEVLSDGLAWECARREIGPLNWRTVLRPGEVDLILLEIHDGAVPGWRAADLDEVRSWAVEHGVPVVGWVTGDAPDPDSVAGWIDGMRVAFLDHDGPVAKWQARWPDAAIEVLLPAAQPRIHNPIKGGAAVRREQAAAVLYHGSSPADAVLAEFDHARLDVWPVDAASEAALSSSPLGPSAMHGRRLPTAQPVLAQYRVLAELGASGSRSSWAVLQAGAGMTPVVVEESAIGRVPEDLREFVVVAEDAKALRMDVAARVWQDELRDREALRLAREIYRGHTFAHRVDDIARAAGLSLHRRRKSVSAVVPTNRPHELDNVFGNIARQAYATAGGVELVLVLHGLDAKVPEIEARAKDAGVASIQVVEADSSLPLGACMNLGIDAAGGDYIAKMDDDNYYGRHYLTDLVAAFSYTEAGIVGKWAHYVWLRSTGAVVLRTPKAEHRYERLVQGGSIVLDGDVARTLRFGDHLPRGVDTDILNRAMDAGVKTYSADRFNYISIRGADRHAHTWTIADTALMNRAGRLAFYGDPREHVDV